MPSLLVDYRMYDFESSRLLGLCGTLSDLSSFHQKLVAEIMLLRLFYLFENLISSVSIKLACGATYNDGTAPVLSVKARSSVHARDLFQAHGRSRMRYQLKWSTASEIKENVKYVVDAKDNFVLVIDRNGTLIDELRRIRNRIAHNNSQSRSNFKEVVRRYYGAYLNHVTPGTLLLSHRLTPSLIEQYIRQTRIVVKDIVKA